MKTHGYLEQLEEEAIYILRDIVASCRNPVMLYSMGKDSSVLLHIARKAFYPEKIPFPALHIDTTWKFKEMIAFRERKSKERKLNLIVYTNLDGVNQNINPFNHGAIYTDIMKTQALKDALDKYEFDAIFGGARRDEEKSRSKERVVSFRNRLHAWDPKKQRPEFWKLYNTHLHEKESLRVFPLSNWTELDIWTYILKEDIEIVPLYFAKERPIVYRNGNIIMVDDNRMPLLPFEKPEMKLVRFRTLGCYPLTGAHESSADTIEKIIEETKNTLYSERISRVIDHESIGSMERRKKEGYF